MALQKQTKQLTFSQGIDTKITPELVPVGKLHSARNVRFNQSGRISKKKGSTAFATALLAGGSIGTVRAAFEHLGGLYAVTKASPSQRTSSTTNASPDFIYGYSPSTNKWNYICKSACVTAETSLIPYEVPETVIAGQGLRQNASTVDAAYVNGYLVTVQCTTGVSRVNIIDPATGEVIVADSFGNSYTQFRVVAFGTTAVVTMIFGGVTLIAYLYDTTALAGTFTSGPVDITNGILVGGAVLYDCFVAPQNGNLYVAYSNGAAGIQVSQYASLPASGPATRTNSITIAEAPTKCLTIFGGESVFQKIYVAYTRAGVGVRVNISSMTLGGSSLITAVATEAEAISGAQATDGNNVYVMMILETFFGAANYTSCRWYGLNATTATELYGTAGRVQLGLCLMSKIAVINGLNYVVCSTNDALERTYFLMYVPQDTTGKCNFMIPVAKLLLAQAGARQSAGKSNLPAFTLNGTTGYVAGYKYTQQQDSNTALFYPALMTFNFADNNPDAYKQRQIGGLNYFTGGIPTCFDGKNFFEAAFPQSPFKPDTPVGSTAAGALTVLGAYQVSVVYEFLDGQGNRQQSAPSIPLSYTLTGTQNTITFQYFPPMVTMHLAVYAVFYRTTANGTVFYREKATLINVMDGVLTGTLTLADSILSTQEILYTAGGVIENNCPTAAKGITLWKNRVWFLTDDGIVYSKNVTDGYPAAFNPVLNLNSLVNKTKPKAIAGIRDKLFAFYTDDIFYTSGDGPSDTGEGAFSPLELAQSGVGCLSSTAIVDVQDSVFFQSRDGWRVINGSLAVAYIGAEIQNYMSEATTIYSTTYVDGLHEVRIMDGNRTYVYDTFEKQWSIISAWADLAGFIWNGNGAANKRYIRLRSDGVILYEDPATFLDAGTFNQMVVTTGWITMDQFLGFERLYKVLVLGRYLGPHTMTINVFYDYVPQIVETFTFNSSSGNFASFTDANVYDNSSYSGNGYPFEVAIRPSQQKCQAIRLEIKDNFVSGVASTFDLVGLNFVLGVRNVDAKIRDAATATGTGRPGFVP